MRLKNICTHEQANQYLEREYLPEHNWRFTQLATSSEDYHCKAPGAVELRNIFRLESERTGSNDGVVRYDNRFFQLQQPSRRNAPARARVLVCEQQEGTPTIEYGEEKLLWKEIPAAPPLRP